MRRTAAAALLLLSMTAMAAAACSGSDSGATCDSLMQSAEQEAQNVVDATQSCTQDSDCKVVSFASKCFDACERVIATANETALDTAIARVNANQCQQFAAKSCTFDLPPCAGLGSAHCVNRVCSAQP